MTTNANQHQSPWYTNGLGRRWIRPWIKRWITRSAHSLVSVYLTDTQCSLIRQAPNQSWEPISLNLQEPHDVLSLIALIPPQADVQLILDSKNETLEQLSQPASYPWEKAHLLQRITKQYAQTPYVNVQKTQRSIQHQGVRRDIFQVLTVHNHSIIDYLIQALIQHHHPPANIYSASDLMQRFLRQHRIQLKRHYAIDWHQPLIVTYPINQTAIRQLFFLNDHLTLSRYIDLSIREGSYLSALAQHSQRLIKFIQNDRLIGSTTQPQLLFFECQAENHPQLIDALNKQGIHTSQHTVVSTHFDFLLHHPQPNHASLSYIHALQTLFIHTPPRSTFHHPIASTLQRHKRFYRWLRRLTWVSLLSAIGIYAYAMVQQRLQQSVLAENQKLTTHYLAAAKRIEKTLNLPVDARYLKYSVDLYQTFDPNQHQSAFRHDLIAVSQMLQQEANLHVRQLKWARLQPWPHNDRVLDIALTLYPFNDSYQAFFQLVDRLIHRFQIAFPQAKIHKIDMPLDLSQQKVLSIGHDDIENNAIEFGLRFQWQIDQPAP